MRVLRAALVLVLAGLAGGAGRVAADEGVGTLFDGTFEVFGSVGVETRLFKGDPEFDQRPQRVQPSVMVRPEAIYEFPSGNDALVFKPYFRYDATDERRTRFDLREANWQHLADDWDLVVGLGKVFWGVTESRHLVDIVNQTDYADDAGGEEKLGQPMINLNIHRDWGSVSLFVLPGFREPYWPGRDGRLRTAAPVAFDDPEPVYESSLAQAHVDVAARWQHTIGDFDVGVSHFHGTSREPRLSLVADDGGRLTLRQAFDIVDQTGVDVQATKGAWLFKFEAISRFGGEADSHFLAAVGGFEYTLYDLFQSGKDLGLLLEYLYDGRNSEAPQTAADNDVFVGMRLAFNDAQDTEILLGGLMDSASQAMAFGLEAERRIGENWKIELDGGLFVNVPTEDFILFGRRKDDFLQARLFRFF